MLSITLLSNVIFNIVLQMGELYSSITCSSFQSQWGAKIKTHSLHLRSHVLTHWAFCYSDSSKMLILFSTHLCKTKIYIEWKERFYINPLGSYLQEQRHDNIFIFHFLKVLNDWKGNMHSLSFILAWQLKTDTGSSRVLEMDGGDGGRTTWTALNGTELHT